MDSSHVRLAAINQLTVQKNCRKLLDIYGQRAHKERRSQERGGMGMGLKRDCAVTGHAHCPIRVNATSTVCHQ